MADTRVFNFSAGPSMLPQEVLRRAGSEIENYKGSGMSVMEMSHRSKVFEKIFYDTQDAFRRVLSIPDNYKILFLQGGASLQFSMVPMNLIGKTGKADYAVTGNFSSIAYEEAKKYGEIGLAASSADANHTYIPAQAALKLNPDASYFYYCSNNTIYGTRWNYVPDTGSVPLVCDMSSEILSRPVDVSKYGILFAGAQKNMAPAGLTVVVIREDLAGGELPSTPMMLNYKTMIASDSMHNTPPCWCVYMFGLMLEWLESVGGLTGIAARNDQKAAMLYDALDNSKNFVTPAVADARSVMNVAFRCTDPDRDAAFLKAAEAEGLVNLKGHRKVGGMRASIYNAMPPEGIARLCDLITRFDREI